MCHTVSYAPSPARQTFHYTFSMMISSGPFSYSISPHFGSMVAQWVAFPPHSSRVPAVQSRLNAEFSLTLKLDVWTQNYIFGALVLTFLKLHTICCMLKMNPIMSLW